MSLWLLFEFLMAWNKHFTQWRAFYLYEYTICVMVSYLCVQLPSFLFFLHICSDSPLHPLLSVSGVTPLRTFVGAAQVSHSAGHSSPASLQRHPALPVFPLTAWQQARHGSFFNKCNYEKDNLLLPLSQTGLATTWWWIIFQVTVFSLIKSLVA